MNKGYSVVRALAIVCVLALFQGCASNPSKIQTDITELVNRHEYHKAIDYKVKEHIVGFPETAEEKEKNRLVEELVKPEEARFIAARIASLRKNVLEILATGDDEGARKFIYDFGVTEQPRVDGPVFLVKTALLNSHVNPATYKRIATNAAATIDPIIDTGSIEDVLAAIDGIQFVLAYADIVNDSLRAAGNAAIAQHCEEEGVRALVASRIDGFYSRIASREGVDPRQIRPNWKEMEEKLSDLEKALKNADVDTEITRGIIEGRQEIVHQDEINKHIATSSQSAENIVALIRKGLKSLFIDDESGENLTTAQLNDAIKQLRSDYRARLLARVKQQQADAGQQNASVQAIATSAAREFDQQARVRAFTMAIGDTVEPAINRILGAGARALRLLMSGQTLSNADKMDLLLAAVYMGFDDTARFALFAGADINGTSVRDELARTPLLLAIQSGMRGDSGMLLEDADLSKRDAKGFGVLHYAVRAGNATLVGKYLEKGQDARLAALNGMTPLILAASLDQTPSLAILLPFSDINAADGDGYTALLRAAENGNLDIVKTLLGANANIDAISNEGDGVIELSALADADDLLDYLLDVKNVPVAKRAVDHCVITGRVMTLRKLVAHDAIGLITDKHLAAAIKKGHLDMIKYLVSIGCDVNAPKVHEVAAIPTLDAFDHDGSIREYLLSQGYRE